MNQEMKAQDAYIGPMFQVINKAKREKRWPSNLHLGIISAKYGFLREDDLISFYDLRMTKSRAKNLRQEILEKIYKWDEELSFTLIYVLLGLDYLESVIGLDEVLKCQIIIENMGGLGIGQKKLKEFIQSFV
jgi:hypothetical protein